jgi:hypothetical protein
MAAKLPLLIEEVSGVIQEEKYFNTIKNRGIGLIQKS